MADEESAQQSWRDERCPCKNGDEQEFDLGARKQRLEKTHTSAQQTPQSLETCPREGGLVSYSECLRDFKYMRYGAFKVCFKRILNVVGMDGKDRSQEEKEETSLSL